MSYLVLARKYRPQVFKNVIGQEHICELLTKAIETERVAHAYLFCGPRGIGKTSCARIFAKSLNCEKGPTLTPCGQCTSCREIAEGRSFDVLEIDGASNRGIDEVRTLRENVKFAPSYGRFKIYIIDEVHMLTTEAFNALLKTLEEPPEHVKFIFATTAVSKLPATILSRCQRFDFKRIPVKTIVEILESIAKKEKLKIEREAFYVIAKAAQGSMRDALSILDQISALIEKKIEVVDICSMLGIVELEQLFDMADSIAQGDNLKALKILDELINQGKDTRQFLRDCIEHFRNLMIIKVGQKSLGRLIDYPVAIKEKYLIQSEKFSLVQILKCIESLIHVQEMARMTEQMRTPLEIVLTKLTYREERKEVTSSAVLETELPKVKSRQKSNVNLIKDNQGHIKIDDDEIQENNEDSPEEKEVEEPMERVDINLQDIRRAWDSLTFAVSRKKMSLATFLQDGHPIQFINSHLTIGLPKSGRFQKENLEEKVNIRLVQEVFSEKLNQIIQIKYVIVDDDQTPASSDEPVINSALEEFGGKVVSQWHNE